MLGRRCQWESNDVKVYTTSVGIARNTRHSRWLSHTLHDDNEITLLNLDGLLNKKIIWSVAFV